MRTSAIIKIADSVSALYETSDPISLCKEAGVILLYFPMGYAKVACKGFIIKQSGNVAITISSDIKPHIQRIVMYHELAHYFLHIRTGIAETMQDFSVGSPASEMEYEADMLAAELSLKDSEVLDALQECGSFFEAAAALHTIPEMLDFKLRVMRERGLQIPDAPISSSGGFLKKVSGND
ncbi:MAG: ImmA/IrrE family metallo-endopeptidase [Eubacteriales bacterium]|nr:ImmA/IrrE family metallo-endopeptidase [Eubacteriales bacterium]